MTDVVHELQSGLKELAAEDRGGWMPLALSDRLREVAGVSEHTQVEVVRLLAAWDRAAAWSEDGAVSAVSWMKHNLGLGPGEAAGLFHLSRLYGEHRVMADALDGHELSLAAARILQRASRRREETFAACVDVFVRLAGEMPLADFADVVAQWVDLVDDQEPHDDSKRELSVVDVGDQTRTQMFGSVDDGHVIRAALEALDTPDPADAPDGPRTPGQRLYDIALDLFRKALADKFSDDPTALGNLDVIVDAETAAEVEADQPGPTDPELLAERTCERPDGTTVSRNFVKALLCSGIVRRVIVDPATGQTLDIGRAQRRFSRRQLRALAVRDGGCAFPGCGAKAKWCDGHHLKPWEDGGPTDLDNGCLLCRRHHRLVHHGGWRLERDRRTGVFTATAPDGRQFFRSPERRRSR